MTPAFQDQHVLESSPTATPAHTRSASPMRGTIKPHSSREAADFVSKLHDITEVREADGASLLGVNPSNRTIENVPISAKSQTTVDIGTPEKYTSAGPNDCIDLLSKDYTSVTQPLEVEGMAQVNTIDGSASVSAASKIQVLLIYFAFNLGLTLYNKAVMIRVSMNATLADRTMTNRIYSSRFLSY